MMCGEYYSRCGGVVFRAGFMQLGDRHARCSQICQAQGMLERMERGGEVWGGGVRQVSCWIEFP